MAKNDGPRTVCAVITLSILSGIALASLVLGAMHLDDCAMQSWIPTWMMLGGIVGVIIIIFSLCGGNAQNFDNHSWIKIFGVLLALLLLFKLVWNVLGSIWLFGQFGKFQDVKELDMKVAGCHNGMYWYGFVYLIGYWLTVPFQIAIFVKAKQSPTAHV